MKKLISILLVFGMTAVMSGCSSSQGASEESSGSASSSANTSLQTSSQTENASSESENEAVESSSEISSDERNNILIAYFSWSGNTEALAGIIQEETGGDLFKIETEEPYTNDYNTLLEQAQQELNENARPTLSGQVENWENYDVVFVGYPNWWSDAPMAVLSFIESYDWSGKTLVPFNTSGGGGFGNSLSSIEISAEGAEILEGFTVDGSSVNDAQGDVSDWISSLDLNQ